MEGLRPRKLPKGACLTGEALERAQAGGWEPALRIRDQDRDGVSGEVVFPRRGDVGARGGRAADIEALCELSRLSRLRPRTSPR